MNQYEAKNVMFMITNRLIVRLLKKKMNKNETIDEMR